jgi:hypothetical protein
MLLEQTAAEEDLSAPVLSMTAGSKSVLSVSISAIGGSIILTKAWEVFSFQGFSQRRGEHGGFGIFRQKFVGELLFSAL